MLAHLESVDIVVSFDEDTPIKLIEAFVPHVLVKGGDWRIENIVGREIVEDNGGKVYSLPLIQGYSTTNLADKIAKNTSRVEISFSGAGYGRFVIVFNKRLLFGNNRPR